MYSRQNFYRKEKSYGRKRKKMLRILLLTAGILLCLGLVFFQGATVTGQTKSTEQVVVISGDTLWSLARERVPPGTDIREYIDGIMLKNSLPGPVLFPGQVLQMP